MLKPILATLAILGAAASIAGLGTFATFTSSASVGEGSISTGSVAIALGAAGPANRLTIGAGGLLPGDTMQRAVDLSNTGAAGTDSLSAITLTTTATTSSLLDTDVTNGLHMQLESCSAAWTESGPPYTYTCGGTTKSVLASSPVIGSNLALSNLASLAPATTDHLLVTLTLPGGAPNTLQGLSSAISYTFTGTQRAATGK